MNVFALSYVTPWPDIVPLFGAVREGQVTAKVEAKEKCLEQTQLGILGVTLVS